ncbi:Zinc finger, GATA-type [Corchorus olitorius]|uniref:Zinc finger, GATA-type n=1 Tax=Corchorus olitorius TaxID=93759 RepID=A0A1R3GD74_9ROSI|nr:Zinc finger, GATA-type [Corchorus olitorius]
MAVEDINCDNNNNNNNSNMNDLSLPGDDLEEFFGFESQLCVPQDSLDDIDWFPNFTDEFISLDGIFLTPEHELLSEDCSAWKNKKRPRAVVEQGDENNTIVSFATKKQRSKRGGGGYGYGKRGCWSAEQIEKMDYYSTKTEEDEEWNKEKRKCSHCQSEKTPQWRMGPLGPKTLCNACGVRYKSGRLVAEYRPAASPTFDSVKHSNFHKKILRRKGFKP